MSAEEALSTPPSEWKPSNASKLKRIIDSSIDSSKRLNLFLNYAKELDRTNVFKSRREKLEAQLLELDLWDYLLTLLDDDISDDSLVIIHNSIVNLMCREEFFLTENGVSSVDFPVKSAIAMNHDGSTKKAGSATKKCCNRKGKPAIGEEEGEETEEEEEEEEEEDGDETEGKDDLDLLVEFRNLAWNTLQYALNELTESYIVTQKRRFIIQVFAVSMILFPQFEQSILHILSAMSPPLPPDIAKFYPSYLSQELPAGGIEQFFYPDYSSETWKQIFNPRLIVEDLMRAVFTDPCYDLLSKPFLSEAINLFGWKSFEKAEPKGFDYSEHLRRFIVSDGFVFFDFISNYFRALRRFGGEDVMLYHYIPSFFVIYRIAIPALQATILSKFSLAQQDVNQLPSYCFLEAMACCNDLLAYPHTINFVLRFVLQPCNLFHFGDFTFTIETLKSCFLTIRRFECPEKEITTAANPIVFTRYCFLSQVILGALFKKGSDFPFAENIYSKFCFHRLTLTNWLLKRSYARDEKEATIYTTVFLSSGIPVKCPQTKETYMIPKAFWGKRDFINKEELSHCLPFIFDYAYFGSFLKMICSSDNHQVLITTLTFLYSNFDMVRGGSRKDFVIRCLLGELFRFLFYHWSHEVRLCYFDILIYKVYNGARYTIPTISSDQIMQSAGLQEEPKVTVVSQSIPELFGGVMNGLRKAVNRMKSRPERNVFEDAMENESDAMDIVICSKIESYIKEVCINVKNIAMSSLSERERKYARAALMDYVQQVKQYEERVRIEGGENVMAPELSFGFQFSKTIYD